MTMKVETMGMRVIALAVGLLLAACTKPNPNRCCNDEADCNAKGIPVGSVCEQGLVCRGNQCISQPCSSSAACDPAAPYCVDELCAETCSEDAQCPGFRQDANAHYCVSGGCAECRDANDCGVAEPVCDQGACRGCKADSDCDSNLCDTSTGACFDEAGIAYAAPNGSTTSACTKASPCTLTRALAVVDATRNRIKLAQGVHVIPYTTITSTLTVELHGPAEIHGDFSIQSGMTLRARDIVLAGNLSAQPATPSGPMPTLELDTVTVADDFMINLNPATLRARRLKMRTSVPAIYLLTGSGELAGSGGATTNRGSVIVIDQSQFDAPTFSIVLSNYSSAQITNSVFRSSSNAISFDLSTLASTVSFSTFYNARWYCANAAVIFTARNNVFLNESPNAPADTVVNTSCAHYYSLFKPQSTTPAGSNNLLNMDPRFVDAAGGDFHLSAGSPAIDAADPAATEAVDFEGTMRPQGARRDMGAFEYH